MLVWGPTPPMRDGQLRVVGRKRTGEEVWMEQSLQGENQEVKYLLVVLGAVPHTGTRGSTHQTAAYLTGRAALTGWINQEPVEQVDALRGRVWDNLLQWDGGILLKGDFVVIWKFQHLLKRQMFVFVT